MMIKSSRLIYRELNESDFNLFYELNSNISVMKYAFLDRYESIELALEAFKNVLLVQKDKNKGTQYIAILGETNIPIGIVDYEVGVNNKYGGIYEIGYFIKPEYWGQGYGTEMGKAMIDFLFLNYKIHKITASCNSNNIGSESIMKKLGMTKEGIFRKIRYKNNRWEDEAKYALLREEWESIKQLCDV